MYVVLLRAGITLAALGVIIYTAWKTKKRLDNRTTNYVVDHVGDRFEDLQSICSVCLEEIDFCSSKQILVLPCNHKFHKECISEVFRWEVNGRRLCPLCRRIVSEEFIRTSRVIFP